MTVTLPPARSNRAIFLVATGEAVVEAAREPASAEQKAKKPNIIYILTDDIGWGELGWQGGGKHRGTPTPTLDRMAREGMKLPL